MWILTQIKEKEKPTVFCSEEKPWLQAFRLLSRSKVPTVSSSLFDIFLQITFEKQTAFPNIILLKFKEVRVSCCALNQFEVYCEKEAGLSNSE